MTDTNTDNRLQLQDANDDGLDHWVCCIHDVTLCGKDASHLELIDFEVASCKVCQSIIDVIIDEDFCPFFPDYKCPPEEE